MSLLNLPKKRGPYKRHKPLRTDTLRARAKAAGLSVSGVRKRMEEKGMTLEEALAKPARWNTRPKG